MATELLQLIGAKTGFAGEVYDTGETKVFNGFIAEGLTDSSDVQGMGRFAVSEEAMASKYTRVFSEHHYKRFIGTRDQHFADADWYRSDFYHNYRSPCGIDDWLHSQFYIPGLAGAHMICLGRAPGDKRFTARDIRILKLFHDELQRLWSDDPHTVGGNGRSEIDSQKAKLSPRLQQTLDRLMQRDSEKQAALHLGVSYHSAHANVKRLHRHFNVNSRGELLAKIAQPSTRIEYDFKPILFGPPPGWQPPAPQQRRVRKRKPSLV